jgi:hypothetical protein
MAEEPQIPIELVPVNDDPPVCSVGMDFLRRFEEARPNDYAFLEAQDFVDLGTSAFKGIAEWDAFTEHVATCEDCKELRAACAER